ncbi:MAG: ATP-binding protein, partial [Acidobacteria bacterium]|nr:ATP-binding protein [Acidobacteriota bacterium]
MRRFTSYGPINPKLHYYMPRESLIEKAYLNMLGEVPSEGGHYFTVWAPRQTGKTWLMQQILHRLNKDPRFHSLKINLEILKRKTNVGEILEILAKEIGDGLGKSFEGIDAGVKFQEIFKKGVLDKPLILILDDFDAIDEIGINTIVGVFRNIYIQRRDESDKTTEQKTYLLHSVALIGVRSVLGINDEKGSLFNVQRNLHIPNLTHDEVKGLFEWYEKESGQTIDPEVIDRLFYETNGQPGLTGWFGELLTETYNRDTTAPITMKQFKFAYSNASNVLPSNNILNLISKVKKAPYRDLVIELFQTDEKIKFRFDNEELNYLYMNGVIEYESVETDMGETEFYCKFSSPFVQARLFNYFSWEIFNYLGVLIHPLDTMEDAVTPEILNIRNIMKRYQAYLDKN